MSASNSNNSQGLAHIPDNVITRIIGDCVPESMSVRVEEDFIRAVSRATSLFILNATKRANELARESSRRTVNAQDLIGAVADLGCEELCPRLKAWHSAYLEENPKDSKKKKSKESGGKNANDSSILLETDPEMEIIELTDS